jgi:hypothetical protein
MASLPSALRRIMFETAFSALLFAWISFAILHAYEELGRHAIATLNSQHAGTTIFLVVHRPLIGVLAACLCAVTSLAYLVAAILLLRAAPWSQTLITVLVVSGTIGALFLSALGAANIKLAGFLSGMLILFGLLGLVFTLHCARAVRRPEVKSWLAN